MAFFLCPGQVNLCSDPLQYPPYDRATLGDGTSSILSLSLFPAIFGLFFFSSLTVCKLFTQASLLLRMNCSMCRCGFGTYGEGDGLRYFLCRHLAPASTFILLFSPLLLLLSQGTSSSPSSLASITTAKTLIYILEVSQCFQA